MAKKKAKVEKTYTVLRGCDLPCGKRYEIGDVYSPLAHDEEITEVLLEMDCLGETDVDS
jgi:hypothetical protein